MAELNKMVQECHKGLDSLTPRDRKVWQSYKDPAAEITQEILMAVMIVFGCDTDWE